MSNYDELEEGELCIEYFEGHRWFEWKVTQNTKNVTLSSYELTPDAKKRLTISDEAWNNMFPSRRSKQKRTFIQWLLGIK